MTSGAAQLFSRLQEYGLIVCKSCKYAIWPPEVDSHLSDPHHRIEKKQRQCIQLEVQSWQGLVTSEDELKLPEQLDEAIPELALYQGFLCRVEPDVCQEVFQSKEMLRKHWQRKHDWTVTKGSRSGRRTKEQQENAQQRFHEAQQEVQCQRFFVTRYGSHYIRVAGEQQAEDDKGPAKA
jgi:uncharacterized C2H2 Zn-finger protein